ncbi:hypothetical protein Pan216_28350 [Planctomycetes bacterium Pan216]|uniref:DUF1559 domain-containing protein n=1 Tax=Kolteria novifilia TaxID=2527975 RepID=A0A518B4Q7_9BACT|nr:hypothetical protein Pan216_28350 [Planctomycetes bacterium Pan216]
MLYVRRTPRILGFTLIELLVVIAIIGVLVGMLLPAVQEAREASRRMSCQNHLKQIGMAMHGYHDAHNMLPKADNQGATDPTRTSAGPNIAILPYMDQTYLQQQYDFNTAYDVAPNDELRDDMPSVFICPSNPAGGQVTERTGYQASDYVYLRNARDWENATAMMEGGRYTKFSQATDGLSKSIMVYESAGRAHWYIYGTKMSVEWDYYSGSGAWGEEIEAWSSHYSAGWFFPAFITLDASNPAGTDPTISWTGSTIINVSNFYAAPYSFHFGGTHLGMGDGSVRFVAEYVDLDFLAALTSCDGGEIIDSF